MTPRLPAVGSTSRVLQVKHQELAEPNQFWKNPLHPCSCTLQGPTCSAATQAGALRCGPHAQCGSQAPRPHRPEGGGRTDPQTSPQGPRVPPHSVLGHTAPSLLSRLSTQHLTCCCSGLCTACSLGRNALPPCDSNAQQQCPRCFQWQSPCHVGLCHGAGGPFLDPRPPISAALATGGA